MDATGTWPGDWGPLVIICFITRNITMYFFGDIFKIWTENLAKAGPLYICEVIP